MATWHVWHRSWARASRRAASVSFCLSLPAALVGLGLALTYRPGWYRPASVDYSRLRADKIALADLQEQISAALNSGREARFRLHQDRLNRWLAARAEVWPESAAKPDRWQHPQVSLADGCVRLGVTGRLSSFRAVVGLSWRVEVSKGEITLRSDAPRLGALPIPRSWTANLPRKLPFADDPAFKSDGRGTIVLTNGWVWPNGKRPCRLRSLEIGDGVADVIIEPWPEYQR